MSFSRGRLPSRHPRQQRKLRGRGPRRVSLLPTALSLSCGLVVADDLNLEAGSCSFHRRCTGDDAQRGEARHHEGDPRQRDFQNVARAKLKDVCFARGASLCGFWSQVQCCSLANHSPAPHPRGPGHVQARTAAKMTQKQLAQALNKQASVIQKFEQGKQVPTNAELARMDKILGTKLPRIKKKSAAGKDALEAGETHPSLRVRSSGAVP